MEEPIPFTRDVWELGNLYFLPTCDCAPGHAFVLGAIFAAVFARRARL